LLDFKRRKDLEMEISAVSLEWAAPVSEDVITIGVERKSRPLITPL